MNTTTSLFVAVAVLGPILTLPQEAGNPPVREGEIVNFSVYSRPMDSGERSKVQIFAQIEEVPDEDGCLQLRIMGTSAPGELTSFGIRISDGLVLRVTSLLDSSGQWHERLGSELIAAGITCIEASQHQLAVGGPAVNTQAAEKGRGPVLVGEVLDASTGSPVAGAQVYLAETRIGTLTESNGMFMLEAVEPGDYVFEIRLIGYEDQRAEITLEQGTVTRLVAVLRRTPLPESDASLLPLAPVNPPALDTIH